MHQAELQSTHPFLESMESMLEGAQIGDPTVPLGDFNLYMTNQLGEV